MTPYDFSISDGFPGRSENVYLPPFSDVNTSLIVTDLSCNLYGLCSNTSISTDMGCNAYGGYAVVTCAVGSYLLSLLCMVFSLLLLQFVKMETGDCTMREATILTMDC